MFSHRAKAIDPRIREARLQGFLAPIRTAWESPDLTQSLSTFQGFCQLLSLDKVQAYLISRRVNLIEDWSTHQLDAEGVALQNEMNDRFRVGCRATKQI